MTPRLAPTRGSALNVRARDLASWADRFAAIGADDMAKRLAAVVAHHDELQAAADDAVATVDTERARLTRSIADGTIDPLKAAAELDKIEKKAALTGPAADLTADARKTIVRDEVRRLRDEADDLTGLLAGIIEAAAGRLIAAVDRLPDNVTTPGEAIATGCATDWHDATTAAECIVDAWRLADRLELAAITWTIRTSPPARYWRWHPAPNIPKRTPASIHEWADAIRAGHWPTMLSAQQVIDDVIAAPAPTGPHAA